MTEDMISKLVFHIHGSYKIQYHPNGPEEKDNVIEIDFTPPFKRIPLMKGLKEKFPEETFPANDKLDTAEAQQFFDNLCTKNEVECDSPRTTARMIDKLCGEYIENTCKNPCYIIDTP